MLGRCAGFLLRPTGFHLRALPHRVSEGEIPTTPASEKAFLLFQSGCMTHSPVWRAVTLSLALAATYGCSGGLSCGSNSGCLSAYPFPQTQAQVPNGAEFVDDGVRMRMTQDALDFLSTNIRPLLQTALGTDPSNPDNILISSTTPLGAAGFFLAHGSGSETHPTEIFINARVLAESLEMEFVGDDAGEPDGIRIRAVDVPIGFEGRLFTDFGLGNAACDVFGTNSDYGGRPFVTGLTLEAIIKPRVGTGNDCDAGVPECMKIDVDVTEVAIGSFGSSALELDKPTSDCGNDGLGDCSEDCSDDAFPFDPAPDLECTAVCFIEDVALDFISAIGGFVLDLIEGFLPGILEGAIQNALADVDGSPLAAAGRLSLSDFAPGVLPASALDMGFAVGPTTGAFDVNDPSGVPGAQGMDLIFKSGFEAAPPLDVADDTPVPHPCVRHIEGNDFADVYGAFAFEAPDADPLSGVFDGQVYHLGASLAAGAMNQALFAAYNSGALCIEASTESIHVLTGGGFPLSAGTLDLLTEGKLRQLASPSAPAIIALAPSQPPVLSYGPGTEDEGHLLINWPSVEISFYVLMNERFARVFAVATDISLQLTVFNDPETGTLRIAVVDGPNIENFVENYNELLPGVAFTEVLESLIGVAFDAALGDGLEFNFDVGPILSNALGGAPVFVDFRAIETVPAADRQFLNVYLGLTSTPSQPRTATLRNVHLASEAGVLKTIDVSYSAPDTGEEIERVKVTTTGEVRIESEDMPFDGNEYFARVDFGAWRGPLRSSPEGVLVVKDPKLRLVGEHTILLRARTIGDPNSLMPVDAAESVKVWVDPEPPRVELVQVGDQLVARGWDIGSRVEDLRWQWQLDDGEWSEASDVSSRSIFEVEARRAAVRAVDGAGNVSKSSGLDVVVARKRFDDEAKANGGCAQVGIDGAWLAGLALAGALGLRPRRRRHAR